MTNLAGAAGVVLFIIGIWMGALGTEKERWE
jgi:hypothetical protein